MRSARKILLGMVLIIFESIIVWAQPQTVQVQPSYGVIEKEDSLNGHNHAYYFNLTSQGKIGRQDDQTFHHYYRARLSFSFSQIPFGARINSCSLYVYIANYQSGHESNKAKIIKLPRNYSADGTYWSQYDNAGTVYYSDRQYSQTFGYLTTSSQLTTDVQAGVNASSPNNDLTIGVLSQNEGDNASTADVSSMYLTINYTPRVSLTIQNTFAGGQIDIDGALKNSPW